MAETFHDNDGIHRSFSREKCASCLRPVRLVELNDQQVTLDVTPRRGLTVRSGGRGGAGKPARAIVTDVFHLHLCPRRS